MKPYAKQQNKHRLPFRGRATAFLSLACFCLGILGPVPAHCADEELAGIPIDMDLGAGDVSAHASDDTISMSFDGALLKDVLLLFSQQSGLNFVATSEVESKKVTVYFENVSPKDALDSIVSANNLAYSKKAGSDIYMVYSASSKAQPSELITKVIRLKYMRLSSSPLDVGGQVTVSDLQKTSAPTSASSGGGGGSAGSSSTRGADKLVKELLSSQGKVTSDLQTNSLIITDTKESIAAVEKVLAQIDVPSMQVILEVNILEVRTILGKDVGIEWGGANGALGTLAGGQRTTQFPLNFARKPNLTINDGDFGDAALGDDNAPSQMSFGTIDAANFSATLHAIMADSETKVLAQPRVLTQNNEAANIKLVTNAAIGTASSTNTTGGGSSTVEEAERAELGVAMRMTPQINDDGTVSLFLEPAVTTADESSISVGGNETLDTTTRLVRTIARVKDNQTLVIGGLINNQHGKTKRKIPFLGDAPLVGQLFRYDTQGDEERELLIFITPHIVRGTSSLGAKSATAQGVDVRMRHMLDQFMENRMDSLSGTFQGFEKTKSAFFTREEELVRDSERRYSNPLVEKQMTVALDALSPQMVEHQISKTMDALSAKT